MKKIEELASGKNFTASTVGEYDQLGEFVFEVPGMKVPGKVFIGQSLKGTAFEASFQIANPGEGCAFLHTHAQNEELYIAIKGEGEFQVDGKIFPFAEGAMVRVAPDGKRAWRNNGKTPLVVLCLQFQKDSLKVGPQDGKMLDEPMNW
jgi:mannose-6-phosphate isomerase-like protein (cupin superfamily)